MKPSLFLPGITLRPLLLTILAAVLSLSLARSTATAEMRDTAAAAVTKLNDSLVTGGNVGTRKISPDNSTVVFLADADSEKYKEERRAFSLRTITFLFSLLK